MSPIYDEPKRDWHGMTAEQRKEAVTKIIDTKPELSATQIASIFFTNATRNSIIGICSRSKGKIRLTQKQTGAKKASEHSPWRRERTKAPTAGAPPMAVKPDRHSDRNQGLGIKLAAAQQAGLSLKEGMDHVLGGKIAAKKLPEIAALPVEEHTQLTILELNEHTCKWPMWGHQEHPTVDDMKFCGRHSGENTPWCEEHRKIATNPAFYKAAK